MTFYHIHHLHFICTNVCKKSTLRMICDFEMVLILNNISVIFAYGHKHIGNWYHLNNSLNTSNKWCLNVKNSVKTNFFFFKNLTLNLPFFVHIRWLKEAAYYCNCKCLHWCMVIILCCWLIEWIYIYSLKKSNSMHWRSSVVFTNLSNYLKSIDDRDYVNVHN